MISCWWCRAKVIDFHFIIAPLTSFEEFDGSPHAICLSSIMPNVWVLLCCWAMCGFDHVKFRPSTISILSAVTNNSIWWKHTSRSFLLNHLHRKVEITEPINQNHAAKSKWISLPLGLCVWNQKDAVKWFQKKKNMTNPERQTDNQTRTSWP